MNQITNNVKNAIIKSVSIDIERGILTGWIELDYGGYSQSFGGYVLHMSDNDENKKKQQPIRRTFYYEMYTNWWRSKMGRFKR